MARSCDYPGCTRTDAQPCYYVDRRGHRCGYSWCRDHSAEVNSANYCRRHGGVVRAIVENTYETIEPPDLDNRALSLTAWVSADLDRDVRQFLRGMQQPNDGTTVSMHPLRLVIERSPYSRGWTRAWTLSAPTGVLKKVAVEVNEARDFEVRATVDGVAVATAVPPWIGDRGTPITAEAADRKRAQFRQQLVDAISKAALAAPLWR